MYLPCPNCAVEIEVSEEDPDGSLTGLWDHLMGHPVLTAQMRERAFVNAQQAAHP